MHHKKSAFYSFVAAIMYVSIMKAHKPSPPQGPACEALGRGNPAPTLATEGASHGEQQIPHGLWGTAGAGSKRQGCNKESTGRSSIGVGGREPPQGLIFSVQSSDENSLLRALYFQALYVQSSLLIFLSCCRGLPNVASSL